ncbi:MAG: sugar ABC transporter substrate-binding protein [Chloroflexota bacterium]|nr:sugar ABC transporter substrate-binding protein [Chloroflexota bacterium]
MRKLLSGLLFVSLVVFLALPVAAQDSVTIGYGAPELSGGQGVIMSGLVNAAQAKGWEVISSNANFDAEAQANQIDNFISQGVDAIVVVPVDSQAICSSVQRAQDAGIPFYTIDRAPLGCEINMTVQSDNYMAGQQAAEGVVELLTARYGEPRGTVLELQGDLGQNVAQLRGGGFNDHLASYENIEIISRPTEWRAENFSQATLDVAASTELDAIYMHSDCVGTKVVTAALDQIGQLVERGGEGHIFLVGVDGCPDALESIRMGYSDQASSQPLPDFGIITDWIEMEMAGAMIETGDVVQEGAPWSPASITDSDTGYMLNLATTSVNPGNVTSGALWGNQAGGAAEEEETIAIMEGVVIGYGAPELSGGQGVIMSGLVNAAEAKGWEVISSNANFDAEAQANQIDNFISQGVDAIVVVPVDSQAICSSVQRAQDAGIPFYTIDRAPLGCEINMTVQSDNYMAGQQAAEGVVELLTARYGEPRGTVLELQGDLGQNVAQLRGGGFNDHLASYENIEIISRPTEWRAENFSQATLDVAASTALDAIYMHSDCVGTKVVTAALDQIGQLFERGEDGHIFLVGVDGCPDALSSIRAGTSDQASSQPLPDFGIITDWINMELQGMMIETGDVVQEGAPWSPASITDSDTGYMLNLATTSVNPDNVTSDALWGNQAE